MTKIKLKDIKKSYGSTNWTKLQKQTDDDVEKAATSSKDSKLLTETELAQLRRAHSEQATQK